MPGTQPPSSHRTADRRSDVSARLDSAQGSRLRTWQVSSAGVEEEAPRCGRRCWRGDRCREGATSGGPGRDGPSSPTRGFCSPRRGRRGRRRCTCAHGAIRGNTLRRLGACHVRGDGLGAGLSVPVYGVSLGTSRPRLAASHCSDRHGQTHGRSEQAGADTSSSRPQQDRLVGPVLDQRLPRRRPPCGQGGTHGPNRTGNGSQFRDLRLAGNREGLSTCGRRAWPQRALECPTGSSFMRRCSSRDPGPLGICRSWNPGQLAHQISVRDSQKDGRECRSSRTTLPRLAVASHAPGPRCVP